MTWFTLGRKDGGPSSYEGINKYFESKNVRIIALSFAIIVPFFAIIIILVLLYKKKRIIPTIKIITCIFTGVSLLVAIFVSSWTKAKGSLIIHNGPVNNTPTKVTVGLKSGILKMIIYMECPGAPYPEYFEENIKLGNEKIMKSQYLSGLNDGWPWPLLYIASLLGGETLAWDSELGTCLYRAAQVTEPCIIASVYFWFLWCISYKIAPSKSYHVMISIGISLLLSAALFCFVIFSCSKIYLPNGQELSLEVDWCTELTAGLGVCFCIVGFGGVCTRRREVKISKYDQMLIIDSRSSIRRDVYVYSFTISQNESENTTANEIQNSETNKMDISNMYNECNDRPLSPTILSNMFVQ